MKDKAFKFGDRVMVVLNHSFGPCRYYAAEITHVTPKTKVFTVEYAHGKKAAHGLPAKDKFNERGWEVGGDRYNKRRIEPMTKELLDAHNKERRVYQLRNVKWDDLDLSIIDDVLALLP